MKRFAIAVVAVLSAAACDPVKVIKAPDAGTTTAVTAPEPQFLIEPRVWGEAGEGPRYEVRELPDGRPGLFDERGALLVHLIPEMLLDVAPAGKKRRPPKRKALDLVKLTPHEGGGFSLFGRLKDDNGTYDLRVENGKGDPRIHVALSARWSRDVTAHRVVAVFRTGPFTESSALGHDYAWHEVGSEWIEAAHTPELVSFGEGSFHAVGRTGVEGLSTRRVADDRWDVEFEMFHHENHPLEIGDDCKETELGGVARFAEGQELGMRADFVVGPASFPLVTRYPEGKKAAVALAGSTEGGAAAVFAPDPDAAGRVASAKVRAQPDAWLGESLAELPCKLGRFRKLGGAGFRSAWSGESFDPGTGGNAFALNEADARRVVAFEHPAAQASADDAFALFAIANATAEQAAPWFSEPSLAQLRKEHGLVILSAELDALLAAPVQPGGKVGEVLTEAMNGSVWVAPVGDVAQRLVGLEDVDLDILPDGVLRVRNAGSGSLEGLTLRLPEGVVARYNSDALFTNSSGVTFFELEGRRDQLVQLFREEKPFAMYRPAKVEVTYNNP